MDRGTWARENVWVGKRVAMQTCGRVQGKCVGGETCGSGNMWQGNLGQWERGSE